MIEYGTLDTNSIRQAMAVMGSREKLFLKRKGPGDRTERWRQKGTAEDKKKKRNPSTQQKLVLGV